MSQENLSLCRISVYLKGDELCPKQISGLIGYEPTEGRRKGETWTTSSNKQIVEKTGLWCWTRRVETEDVASVLAEFLSTFPDGMLLGELPGVVDAYLDVFIANEANESGGGEVELILGPQCLNRLATMGLPLQLTFNVVKS